MVERFEYEHWAPINEWFKERAAVCPPWHLLPRVGYVVPNVAAGFLYLADGGLGFLEHYISNPRMPLAKRKEALGAITEKLIVEAKAQGVKKLFALTNNKSIMGYCNQFEFTDNGTYQTYVKEL